VSAKKKKSTVRSTPPPRPATAREEAPLGNDVLDAELVIEEAPVNQVVGAEEVISAQDMIAPLHGSESVIVSGLTMPDEPTAQVQASESGQAPPADPPPPAKPQSHADGNGAGTPPSGENAGNTGTSGSGGEGTSGGGGASGGGSEGTSGGGGKSGGGGGGGNGVKLPAVLPVLPIRGTVAFPGTIIPLAIGRPTSRRMLDESLPQSKIIALFTQRDEVQEEPGPDDLYPVGVAANVLKLIRQPDETVSIIVHGLTRITLKKVLQRKPFLRAEVSYLKETDAAGKSFSAGVEQLRSQSRELIDLTPNAPEQAQTVLMNIPNASNLADFLAANLNIDADKKQDLLEELDVAKRVRLVHQHVSSQLQIAKLQQKIQQDVQNTIGEGQRKFFLREQMKAIQKELGEDGDGSGELVDNLRKKLTEAQPPQAVMKEAERELKRLDSIPSASPEYSMILTYLELVADLPWSKSSEDNLDLHRARRILDRDHFDLDKVKRRLIEYLAVRKLNPQGRGPILCLIGPPGVGKTSLGQSVADALGRKFARLSLGGIRDEAEIRGHRRTYIGAMPGRIVQEIRRAGTNNPVMMLDEVDKLGSDFRGDPASALLEVLDPRQNHTFSDRYLDVPFDLTNVLFIATANFVEGIPRPLYDRMEVIDIPGYTDFDKLQIAKRYLVPRQLSENGLKKAKVTWQPPALRKVIDDYTREAGVRELERQIGAVCRGIAAQVADASPAQRNGKDKSNGKPKRRARQSYAVNPQLVRDLLGPEKYVRELDTRTNIPGLVIGLAYTPVGGDILFIEATAYPGKGNVKLTGQIGDVMKESADAALSLFKSRAPSLGYDPKQLAEKDLHIHVPAGAIPKDGPSAGVAMFTAIASLLLGKPVKQRLAMTGEITLRGRVLPIGGVKEKTLAASRADIKTVLLPKLNEKDLAEADPRVMKKLNFQFLDTVDDLLHHALGINT
jgi:ATP-dependent Lon protease